MNNNFGRKSNLINYTATKYKIMNEKMHKNIVKYI